jgi:hypothetical protein
MFFGPFLTKFLSKFRLDATRKKNTYVEGGGFRPLHQGWRRAYSKGGTALMFQESFLKKLDKRSNITVERGVLRREWPPSYTE